MNCKLVYKMFLYFYFSCAQKYTTLRFIASVLCMRVHGRLLGNQMSKQNKGSLLTTKLPKLYTLECTKIYFENNDIRVEWAGLCVLSCKRMHPLSIMQRCATGLTISFWGGNTEHQTLNFIQLSLWTFEPSSAKAQRMSCLTLHFFCL